MKAAPHLFPLRWWLQVGCFTAILAGILAWKPQACTLQTSSATLAPGLTLTTLAQQTPDGATQIYVVRGDRKSAWRFALAPAQGNVLQRETVSAIARRTNAAVAVNGGFFAYEGAAIGAVKSNGEWIRLPWKSRSAIGFQNDGTAHIANLHGATQLKLGDDWLDVAQLNGFPVKDSVSILTARFGPTFTLRPGECALEVQDDKVARVLTTGTANIAANGFVAVANGTAQPLFAGVAIAQSIEWKVETAPADWNDYPTILGAGPRLVVDGKAAEASREEEFRPDVLQRGPRTGVGVDAAGNPLLVIADGRQDCSPGLTLPELATLMASLGARDALHMDCGPSSVLVVNGKVANHPMANQPSGLNEPTVPNAVLMTSHE